MTFLKYLAIALGLVLFCVENTYVLGQHVCTYHGMEKIPGHNGIGSQVRKIQLTRKEKNKELTKALKCVLSTDLR